MPILEIFRQIDGSVYISKESTVLLPDARKLRGWNVSGPVGGILFFFFLSPLMLVAEPVRLSSISVHPGCFRCSYITAALLGSSAWMNSCQIK